MIYVQKSKRLISSDFSWCYNDVIMSGMASQITSFTIVYSSVYSGADQGKHQSSASLDFVSGIHRWPVNSPHKWPVTRKCFHLMTSPWVLCFISEFCSKNSWSDIMALQCPREFVMYVLVANEIYEHWDCIFKVEPWLYRITIISASHRLAYMYLKDCSSIYSYSKKTLWLKCQHTGLWYLYVFTNNRPYSYLLIPKNTMSRNWKYLTMNWHFAATYTELLNKVDIHTCICVIHIYARLRPSVNNI